MARTTQRFIRHPKNKQEGLANFVALIINELEQGNTREALLKAEDLWNDLQGKHPIYKVQC